MRTKTTATSMLAGLALTATAASAAVLPLDGGPAYVERPVTGGYYGQPVVGAEARYEGHPDTGGALLWVLDRQTGRVRTCRPAPAEGERPACSPWNE